MGRVAASGRSCDVSPRTDQSLDAKATPNPVGHSLGELDQIREEIRAEISMVCGGGPETITQGLPVPARPLTYPRDVPVEGGAVGVTAITLVDDVQHGDH